MAGEGILPARPLMLAPLEFRTRSGGRHSPQNSLVTCPVCEAPAFVRRSERVTRTVKHLHGHCTNTGCGATFRAEIALIHMFNPGLDPDPDLPICQRDQVPHVLPPAREGEDDSQISMFSG